MIGRTNTGGGSGSLQSTDAILRVIAPAGSTVTISKGGVSKSDLGHENADDNSLYDYYFVIHQSQFDSINAWTVTATDGVNTATDTIIIDSANEYDVLLTYRYYIYDHGTQYLTFSSQKESNASVSFGSGYISQTGASTNGFSGVYTTQTIQLDDYRSICFEIDYRANQNSSYKLKAGISTASNWYPTMAVSGSLSVNSGVIQTLSLDISNITGSYYVVINGTISARTYAIYVV